MEVAEGVLVGVVEIVEGNSVDNPKEQEEEHHTEVEFAVEYYSSVIVREVGVGAAVAVAEEQGDREK